MQAESHSNLDMQVQASTTNTTLVCPFIRTNYTSSTHRRSRALRVAASYIPWIGTRTVRRSASPSASAAPQTVHRCIVPQPQKGQSHPPSLLSQAKRWAGALYLRRCGRRLHSAPSFAILQTLLAVFKPPRLQASKQKDCPRTTCRMARLRTCRQRAVRRSTDHAQDCTGGGRARACLSRPSGHRRTPAHWQRAASERRHRSRQRTFLTCSEAFLAQFTVENELCDD